MPQRRQVYKCDVCGNIVEVLHGGDGDLVCCGEDMKLLSENVVDAAKEKHVPVVESAGDGVKVKVGSSPHPMEDKHYIEWIEIIIGDESSRHYLKPGESPEAVFQGVDGDITAREYCNLHGLWKS